MTLKLKGGLDILKMYLHVENKIAVLRHLRLLIIDETCKAYDITSEMKNTQIALKVKGQGQKSPTSNHVHF